MMIIIIIISDQHTWKARRQGTTENSHTGALHTYTSESTDMKSQNV